MALPKLFLSSALHSLELVEQLNLFFCLSNFNVVAAFSPMQRSAVQTVFNYPFLQNSAAEILASCIHARYGTYCYERPVSTTISAHATSNTRP